MLMGLARCFFREITKIRLIVAVKLMYRYNYCLPTNCYKSSLLVKIVLVNDAVPLVTGCWLASKTQHELASAVDSAALSCA